MKRALALFIAVIMTAAVLVSCATTPDTPSETETTTVSTGEVTTAPGGELSAKDALGFDVEDNGDKTFTVLLNNANGFFDLSTDFFQEADSGTRVNSETFKRNIACEEYLGIHLNYILEEGDYNSKMPDKIWTDVYTNNTSSYDMVAMGLNTGLMSGYVDIFADVTDMEYVNLSHPWWISGMEETASVNGRMIFLAGDCCISLYGYIGCIFANPNVAEVFQLGVDLYDLVDNREWTLEKFLEFSENVRQDASGDGQITPDGKDIFGWANCSTGVRNLWSACNVQLLEREDDNYVWKETLDNTTLGFISQLKLASERDNTLYFSTPDGQNGALKNFINDKCLFISYYVYLAQQLSAESNGYMILPMPMLNKAQGEYVSTNVSAFNALFFPTTLKNPALSAKVAEFMGWYGQKNVIPAYYDVSLKYQYNNVEKNVAMLDLIRNSLRISPNEVFGVIGNGVGVTALTDQNTASDGFYSTPVSVWAKKYPVLKEKLDAYTALYYED